MHLITVENGAGSRRQAVLRRYVRPEVNADEPDLAEREARTLGFVERLDVAMPRLVALDSAGDVVGVPALLMTRVPGRVDWWPTDVERWLRGLAELLPKIHARPTPAPGVIGPYAPYAQTSYDPPSWATQPRVWERAAEIFCASPPVRPAVFLQRDFHPGNVLWQRGAVSGVVDWQAASVGAAVVDVGHCRANLLGLGPDVAQRFTGLWEQASGSTFHPWADVVAILGFLDGLRDDPGSDGFVMESALAWAVAELRGT